MTTIAYKDGVVAADSLVTEGSRRVGYTDKLYRLHDGSVVALAGSLSLIRPVLRWFENRRSRENPPEEVKDDGISEVVRFTPEGDIEVYERGNIVPFDSLNEFYAFGSGASYALGAMTNGASPAEAVKIASEYDIFTGGDIIVMKV